MLLHTGCNASLGWYENNFKIVGLYLQMTVEEAFHGEF